MKKIFFLSLAALMSTALFAQLQVATFEDVEVSADSVYLLNETGTFTSGDFTFDQDVQNYGVNYYFGNVVTSKKANKYLGDAQNYMSSKGGAFAGSNFVVWYTSYIGADRVHLNEAAVIPGFYICNTPWVIDAVENGDGMSGPFEAGDYLTVIINGYLDGNAVNNQIEFKLVDGTTPVTEWTYIDLSELGEVDEISFTMDGTKKNDYGLTTPTYFAMDNFGAEASTEAVENTFVDEKAHKAIVDGQVVIIRGNKTFNIMGAEL